MKTDLSKILTVSGYSGLYLFISESKNGVIAESLIDKKRSCLSGRDRMSSLSDIAVYTDADELRLQEVFEKIKAVAESQEVPAHKADPKLIQAFFQVAIPNYDRSRFYASHMKKVIEWYHILRQNDALDFEVEGAEDTAASEEPKETKASKVSKEPKTAKAVNEPKATKEPRELKKPKNRVKKG